MTHLQLRSDDLEWREVDDDVVVLDLKSGNYLTLNSTAGLLFLQMIDGATREDLVKKVVDTYEITEEEATADVGEFVETLRAEGLLQSTSA